MSALFIFVQHLLPHQLLSRLAGTLARCETAWLKNLLIRHFIRVYRVDMTEAEHGDPAYYASFNAFFTRALKAGVRSLPPDPRAVLSPADGAISAIGRIHADTLLQAKGHDYSLTALLGGEAARAAPFHGGNFATVYLSPKDYHRVHIPLGGTLREMIHVPGRLFSVNQTTADNIPGLFARNERVICLFDTAAGPMAVILVGAMIVAGIETVWAGAVTPAAQDGKVWDYRQQTPPIRLEKGAELGRFKLGSTVIVLFGPDVVQWQQMLTAGSAVRMGQQLGTLL
jgi:phosphatidylserine decarboxylase